MVQESTTYKYIDENIKNTVIGYGVWFAKVCHDGAESGRSMTE
jgi:hypothetical protein